MFRNYVSFKVVHFFFTGYANRKMENGINFQKRCRENVFKQEVEM